MSTFTDPGCRNDYIRQLEKKCEEDFPQEMENIEEEMETLSRLHSQLLSERKDVLLEMEYLKESLGTEFNLLMDLPATVWVKLIRMCSATQNNSLLNACLASINLEEKISQNCPSIKNELIGRNAFAVLVRDYYLDDLLNCLNSKCESLQDSAATGWRYLKNTVEGSKVSFNNSKAISSFMEEIKGKENPWEIFISKCFEFDGGNLSTKGEQKEFLAGLNQFLVEFGKFIFCLWTKDMEWIGTETNFFQNLFYTVRNMQIFQDYHGSRGPFHQLHNRTDKSNTKGIEPFFEIYPGTGNQTFFKATASNCSILQVYYDQVDSFCTLEEGFFRNIEILKIDTDYFKYPNYKRFLAADLSVFANLEQVHFRGTEHYLFSLAFLTKFPRVREIFLDFAVYRTTPQNNPPPRDTFEFVRKFTFEFRYEHPPSLDDIPEVLPSLRYFCLKTEWCKLKLMNMLAEYISNGFFQNYVIDLYNVYAEARPLNGSNIWQHMTSLRTLVVETTASYLNWEHFPGNRMPMREGAYTKRREIYNRDKENVIKMQETVFPH